MSMITGIICEALTAAEMQRQSTEKLETTQEQHDRHKEFAKSVIRSLQRIVSSRDGQISTAVVEDALLGDPLVLEQLKELDIDLTAHELIELIRRMSETDGTVSGFVALKAVASVVSN